MAEKFYWHLTPHNCKGQLWDKFNGKGIGGVGVGESLEVNQMPKTVPLPVGSFVFVTRLHLFPLPNVFRR